MYPISQVTFGPRDDSVAVRHRVNGWQVSIVLTLMLLAGGAAEAATKLQAPVKMLMKGHKNVAVLKAVEKAENSRVTFETQQRFYGQAEGRLVVRLDPATHNDLREGQTYVVGFSNVRRNFRFRELREVDPEGYRVVTILGGGPALLEDSPAVRLLFKAAMATEAAADSPSAEDLFQAALTAVGSEDARTSSFGVLELSLRSEWLGLFEPKDIKRVRGYLASDALAPESRDRLFELADKLPAHLKDTWLAEEARRTLSTIDPQLDLTTFVPRLAKTVLGILEEQGSKADSALVAPFLESNNPGVVEAALGALDHADPTLARQRAKVLIERSGLHAESQRVLKEYLG